MQASLCITQQWSNLDKFGIENFVLLQMPDALIHKPLTQMCHFPHMRTISTTSRSMIFSHPHWMQDIFPHLHLVPHLFHHMRATSISSDTTTFAHPHTWDNCSHPPLAQTHHFPHVKTILGLKTFAYLPSPDTRHFPSPTSGASAPLSFHKDILNGLCSPLPEAWQISPPALEAPETVHLDSMNVQKVSYCYC